MNPTKGDGLTVCTSQPAKTHTNNATDFIAACDRMASAKADFFLNIASERIAIGEAIERELEGRHGGDRKSSDQGGKNSTLIEVQGEGGIQVGQVVPPDIGYKKPPPQVLSFAAETAAITGESKRDVNRHLARAEALGDNIDGLATTSPVLMFLRWGCSKADVADVAGVAAPIHAGFGCNVMLFSDVADVAARATTSPVLMFLRWGYSKADVSDVSGVQAPIHAGLSRYGTDTADVSGVSARGIGLRQWRTTKAQFADNGAALNPSRRCRAVERALQVRHLKRAARVAGAFQAGRCADIWRTQICVLGCCDRVQFGASHTKTAGNLSVMGFFHVLNLNVRGLSRMDGFGAGSAYPQGRQHVCLHVTKPSPTRRPSQPDGGFQSQTGAETMTTVNTLTTPKKGTLTLGTTPATSPVSIARRIAIEAALSLALFHVRHDNTHAAVGRAIRAASMLKQACAEATTTTAGRV